jgi:hypothetical protein
LWPTAHGDVSHAFNILKRANASEPVDVAPMPHDPYIDAKRRVIDFVDDPVVPDANTPRTGSAFQLGAPGRSWKLGKRLKARNNP